MRILGVALLTVMLLALLRFAFLQPDVQSLVGLRGPDGRVQHDLVSNLPLNACSSQDTSTRHTFMVRESDTWTALAGSPGYASASFNIPKEVAVVDGVLILDVRAELQARSVARMRVNINGERRGEIILAEGTTSNTIRINLLDSDLTQSQLNVTLGAFGSFPQVACRRDWNGGLIVRIDPTSRIELTTEGPLLDLNDRLRATGTPHHITWPEEATNDTYERLINFAVDQRLRGIRTEFVPTDVASCPVGVTFSGGDLETAKQIIDNGVRAPETQQWPVEIASEGANAEAKFFEYETSWRHSYDLRTTPDAEYPTALVLGLRAVGLQPEAEWLLTVTLNGAIVFAERFEGDTLDLNRTIELPFDLHAFSNVLEIKLISSERQDQAQCTSGSPITAQLKRSTVLRGGVAAPDKSIGEFINALNGPLKLEISDDLNAAEASTTVQFLAETFGDRVEWDTEPANGQEDGYVFVSTRSELQDRFAEISETWTDHLFWLVSPTLPDVGELPYEQTVLTDVSLLDFDLNEGPRIAAVVAVKRPTPVVQPGADTAAEPSEAAPVETEAPAVDANIEESTTPVETEAETEQTRPSTVPADTSPAAPTSTAPSEEPSSEDGTEQ